MMFAAGKTGLARFGDRADAARAISVPTERLEIRI